MKHFTSFLLFACFIYISACSVFDSGDDEPEIVMLSVTSSSEDAGSVSPASGEFESGDSVTVDANPYNGFGFVEWSGDKTSTDNPFTFIINNDTDLVGNFEAVSSQYRVDLFVADTTDTLSELSFGQLGNATEGIDLEDQSAPPPPPGDNLHAWFKNEEDLFHDYRSTTAESTTWTLQLQPGLTDSLHLFWSVNETVLNGSLTLRSEDSSIEVDMVDTQELSMGKDDEDHLLIEYQLGI